MLLNMKDYSLRILFDAKGAYTLRAEQSEGARGIAERSDELFTCKRSGAARWISRYEGFCAFLLVGAVKNKRNTGSIPPIQRKKIMVNFIICSKSSREMNLDFSLT